MPVLGTRSPKTSRGGTKEPPLETWKPDGSVYARCQDRSSPRMPVGPSNGPRFRRRHPGLRPLDQVCGSPSTSLVNRRFPTCIR